MLGSLGTIRQRPLQHNFEGATTTVWFYGTIIPPRIVPQSVPPPREDCSYSGEFFMGFFSRFQTGGTAWMGAEHIKTYDDCSITCWQIVFILPLFHVEKLKLAKQYQSIPLVGKAISKRDISFTKNDLLIICRISNSIMKIRQFHGRCFIIENGWKKGSNQGLKL